MRWPWLERGFELVIGLEVHVELRTATKLFCGCANAFGQAPNTNVCPVCLGLPGSLPVVNARCVEIAMAVGAALGSRVQSSQFHRKNYFYPDMPKNYQISQYDVPICAGGAVELDGGRRIRIERAHLEEDTGKLTHVGGGGRIESAERTLIDYNRAGVPLLEIVSAPDLRDPDEVRAYVSELRAIVVAVGASDGRMEEGSLRVDANVSVRPIGSEELRTRVELKNLNSLRSLQRAIAAEAMRQIESYERGEPVVQQTRHWDEARGATVGLRTKEAAEDYRYFPEPDLPPLVVDQAAVEAMSDLLVASLPRTRRARLADAAVSPDVRETAVSEELWAYTRVALDAGLPATLVARRVANEIAQVRSQGVEIDPARVVEVLKAEADGLLLAQQVREVLRIAAERSDPIEALVAAVAGGREGLEAEAARLAEEVAASAPEEWGRFVAGDAKIAGFLVGQVVRRSGGKVPGQLARRALDERASSERSST
ncbi:glutamyl-tRNA(Gln) amidotransferase, B subunit [Acidimicrobium ferrooxidans DSM 10331]|uniref:Aspartyl/glutamyl-tRNA(Asn/Gln) amidotransferase subunit B n=1 Tax=Acidimicrobium ferrooxidans (strain DSM 10331 / JCM 15462 / NBRC 103882 / ICP) TaxID=525909 RepID=C7M0G3_ACIFD|nr:Asp-tRNA(Asn)/Glu-tRNA(Gln) amidotransferase subunit GatB [Acidimicrobium ferrooxidans]ACU54471.1 glutamyl-tRNA(Gln) amidotransferase, B subunit [Acidimicrobium ferrooxidans DSM 10331]